MISKDKKIYIILLVLSLMLCLFYNLTYALTIKNNHYYYNKRDYYKSSWQWLDLNDDGIYECYYFNVLGHMYKDGTTPDGYKVNDKGEWIVDGVVQRKTDIEVRYLYDINIATISSTYSTKNHTTEDVKRDFTYELDEFITEKEKEVRNRLVTKEVDEKILFDLQGQYITNMNDIYNSYYKQLVEIYDKEEITRVDFNDSKTALVEILRDKERLLKKKLSDLSKDILWQYIYDELKEKEELVIGESY